MSRLACALLFAVLAVPALGQGNGFVAGDMYMYTPAPVDDPAHGQIVHFDFNNGDALLHSAIYNPPTSVGNLAFDPYRQRLIVRGSLGSAAAPVRIHALDAEGNSYEFGLTTGYSSFAPTGDGRIYMHNHMAAVHNVSIIYLNSTNEPVNLLNLAGTGPFTFDGNPGFPVSGMIYDAATNALFVASSGATGACSGGPTDKVTIRKLLLSTDGTKVAAATQCTSFEVSSTGETPVGWSRAADGDLILVVDTNSNAQEPRMLRVNPATLAVSVWASNGPYTGAAATNAGSYSTYLEEVVIVDTFNDELRSYEEGSSGFGNSVYTADLASPPASSGEQPTLIEVPDTGCSGSFIAWSVGLQGAGGLRPRISGAGCPEAGGVFTLTIDRVVGGATGMLFVGLSPFSQHFKGGFFLVGSVVLNVPIAVGGTPGGAGAGSLVLPAGLPSTPALIGLDLFLQAAFVDGVAVQGVSLSQGLRIGVG